MRNSSKQLLAILCVCAAGSAIAESAVDSLAKIEEETMILKAREKQLAVKAQIAAKEAELAAKQADSRHVTNAPDENDPVVQAIEGIGQSLHATLQLRNGSTLDVSKGDVLPNGMKINSIRANEVIVETAKNRRIRLATGSATTTTSPQAMQRNVAQVPPLPSMPPSFTLPSLKGAAR